MKKRFGNVSLEGWGTNHKTERAFFVKIEAYFNDFSFS